MIDEVVEDKFVELTEKEIMAQIEAIGKKDADLTARAKLLLKLCGEIHQEFKRLHLLWNVELDPESEKKIWEALAAERQRRAKVLVASLAIKDEDDRLLAEKKRLGELLVLCSSKNLKVQ